MEPAAAARESARQLREIFTGVAASLRGSGAAIADVCFVHLYLADIAHFGTVNAAYCEIFGTVNPPSRSCVAVALPPGVHVLVDCWAVRGSGAAMSKGRTQEREVLHVQGMSHWAPVCIGPYSQVGGRAGACGGGGDWEEGLVSRCAH